MVETMAAPVQDIDREQAVKHLTAVISHLRSCSLTEARSGARRCMDLLSAWMEPADTWQAPKLSLLDAKGYVGTVKESGHIYGLCPHHLVPYYGNYQLIFLPGPYLVGLSSISRAVDSFCRKALLQESLTQELGEFFYQNLQPNNLEICITARHFCKEMGATNHSSSTQGFVTRWQR
ncbi:GTP cyclohydrolase I [Candidatus Haliotispira prima]|uniref:GTP cyclohydrolase I n=1 Tax=Candidatus Haliotispira prima TaxID=3034016 RepID=A0ABY8MLC1_9SPIO|nr:GTP cyclohydrolase I [Candidatus Haliotispira prima]